MSIDRRRFRLLYRDDRGGIYMTKKRISKEGEVTFAISCHKKDDRTFRFRKVKGLKEYDTRDEAEKELKAYAEKRKMKPVF